MKTYSAKPTDVERKWYVIDASQLPLGRLSTKAAELLTGKGKPMFTHHIDCGDYVIVINADQLVVTGKKMEDKTYYRHSGYPGGLRETSMKHEMGKDSTKIVRQSIRGMLPINKLRDGRLARLKIYKTSEHEHEAQKPTQISLNNKKEKKS